MGFGFNLFFIFIILPLSSILLLLWATTQRKTFGKLLRMLWGGIFILILLATTLRFVRTKKKWRKKTFTVLTSLTAQNFQDHKLTGNTNISDLKSPKTTNSTFIRLVVP